MTRDTYQQLILEGIQGLPSPLLEEVMDFVLLVRKRFLDPHAFQEDLQDALLRHDLQQLSQQETAHIEQEFEGYEHRYPVE